MTNQVPDRIYYSGASYSLHSEPLKPHLESLGISWAGDISACWRGYIAHWNITNDYLYLLDLDPCSTQEDISIEIIFRSRAPIKAAWYTGTLNLSLKGDYLSTSLGIPRISKSIEVIAGEIKSHRHIE